ncbi:peptide ABC transporter substrate-binding protein [Brevibacillus migulae]|uniref:peptide ABC transporter substrate-binding protein n=1 Tax=Brevibacillus migulae TaxID=1644114 RepID=UPI00106E87D6|nr:peptide ABC transporter substrate-binding protein [Brevibacillus migulae]
MNKQMRLTLSTVLITSCIVPMGAAAADSQSPASSAVQTQPSSKQSLRINLHSEVPTVDPAITEDQLSAAIVRATFDGLMRTGTDGKLKQSVAEKVQVSSDLKTYTFTLRNSQWSNGEPVTAHDFEYAWKRALDPRTASNYAFMLYYVKNAEKANKGEAKLDEVGVKALSDKVLQVTLEGPTPFFLELTTFPIYYPVNKKVAESNPKWAAEADTHVGNGPFQLKEWKHKESLVLEKTQGYWDKDAVKLERIEATMYEDENEELALFQKGELDWAGQPLSDLPENQISTLKQQGILHTQPIAGVYWYKFNTEQAPFQNVKIRKAFAYALDRKALLKETSREQMLPAYGVISPSMAPDAKSYLPEEGKESAKKLLAEGMKELGITELPRITLYYNTSEAHKAMAKAVQKQWKEVLGVRVKLENVEWKVFLDKMHNGDYQVARMGWLSDFNDPINTLELFQTKEASNNDTNWENAEYRKLLEQSFQESSPEKRKQLLAKAESILMDEMPVMPLYFYTSAYLKKENVKGVVIDGLGYVDWKWTSKE